MTQSQAPKTSYRKYFEALIQSAENDNAFDRLSAQSLTWYRNKVRDVFGVKDIKPDLFFSKINYPNRPVPGNIVTFQYLPVTKDKLKFYDVFPLVLILRVIPGGFLGLNFHYLHPYDRALLMSRIRRFERPFGDGTIRINIRYNNFKSFGGMPFHKECIKSYKRTHIRTMFYTLTPDEWDIALFLPTERFVKKQKQQVWRESRERLRGINQNVRRTKNKK